LILKGFIPHKAINENDSHYHDSRIVEMRMIRIWGHDSGSLYIAMLYSDVAQSPPINHPKRYRFCRQQAA